MDKQTKVTKILLIIFGGMLTIFSLFSLFQVLITRFLTEKQMSVENIWIIFMPTLLIIGLAFLLTGIFITKIKNKKLLIHSTISILSIIWLILYIVSLGENNLSPSKLPDEMDRIIASVFYYFGIIVCSLLIIIPELIIGIKLYKIEKKNNAT